MERGTSSQRRGYRGQDTINRLLVKVRFAEAATLRCVCNWTLRHGSLSCFRRAAFALPHLRYAFERGKDDSITNGGSERRCFVTSR